MLFRNSNILNNSSRPILPRKCSFQLTNHDDTPDFQATTRVNLAHLTQLGAWIFESSCFMNVSTTTLYLAVSIIDRLRQLGFIVQTGKIELLGAVALLLSSKFNEVEQLRVQNINACLDKGITFSLEQFRDMEGEVLETLGFAITDFVCFINASFAPVPHGSKISVKCVSKCQNCNAMAAITQYKQLSYSVKKREEN